MAGNGKISADKAGEAEPHDVSGGKAQQQQGQRHPGVALYTRDERGAGHGNAEHGIDARDGRDAVADRHAREDAGEEVPAPSIRS